MTNVTLLDGITSIGNSMFYSCTNLNRITVPASVTSMGYFALYYCSHLTDVGNLVGVTNIGDYAFEYCSSLSRIDLPNLLNMGARVFAVCSSLTDIAVSPSNPVYSSVGGALFNKEQTMLIQCPGGKVGNYAIPNSVTNIGAYAFYGCASLTNVEIPDSVVTIGSVAFDYCTQLNRLTIPRSVASIENNAFGGCASYTNLICAFFKGNAPTIVGGVFDIYSTATVFYMPGTTGWSNTYSGRPSKLWNPQAQTSGVSFGVRTNRFGFNLTGSSNLVVVVEACTNLFSPIWQPVKTNTLNTFVGTNGTAYFSDPQWTNYPGRFYRLRSP